MSSLRHGGDHELVNLGMGTGGITRSRAAGPPKIFAILLTLVYIERPALAGFIIGDIERAKRKLVFFSEPRS